MDAGFTVGTYSVQREERDDCSASIMLTDRRNQWRARVEFIRATDAEHRPHVEEYDEHCGRVLMEAASLEEFVELLEGHNTLYVAFSTEADLFMLTAKEVEEELAA